MHILHVTPYYAPAYAFGGVVRAVEGLTQALVHAGQQVTVLTTDALILDTRSNIREEMLGEVRVIRVPNRVYALRRVNLSTPFGLGHVARELLPTVDVVHLHEFRTVENWLLAPLAAAQHKPLILSPHGTINLNTGRSTLKMLWDRVLSPRVARQIQHVVALVQPELDDVQALWSHFGQIETRFSMIPNGINPADFSVLPDTRGFRQQYGLEDKRIVLFLGRLHERKGVEVLVRAFNQAQLEHTKLVLAGPDEGMLATLQPLLNERIVLTGYLDSETRLAALAAADVFALPAVGEGLSMAVLEAMAAGLPVLLSPGCNLPEAAEAGAGVIVEPQVKPLTTALQTLLSDTGQLQLMGDNARQLVHERFTWERVAAQMVRIYEREYS